MIAASAVPIAMCITKTAGNPCAANMSASEETMMVPPPIPSSPAKNPVAAPIARYAASSAIQPLEDELPLRFRHGSDREPVAAPQREHAGERGARAHLRERHEACLAVELHVDQHPARLLGLRLRVEIGALGVELRRIGVGPARDLREARDARLRAARVVEEDAVAHPHVVAHEIARRVVAHAEPRGGLLRGRDEVVDRELVGLGLHEPVVGAHGSVSNSSARYETQPRCITKLETDPTNDYGPAAGALSISWVRLQCRGVSSLRSRLRA